MDLFKNLISAFAYQYFFSSPHVLFNHPTQEHFLPLFAAMGAGGKQVEKLFSDIEMDILALDTYKFY
ncbi:hypothetical protein [Pseudoalteromonas piscicida]|uniref:hypothetical protein n=1 Tax=Pseudoalteromonas piscicida TaxID=43662 RepID=UPI0032C1A544